MFKILFIILDGLGDKPIKEFGNKTPLEKAKTPNLDYLVQNGICGLISPVFFGDFPTSKDAHLSLFGYDLKKWSIGRGVFEALGIDMKLKKGDIALRGNFATIDKEFVIIDRRAGRISEPDSLIKRLNGIIIDRVKFFLKKSVSHRFALILRGKNLSEKISDGDFHKSKIRAPEIKPIDKTKSAEFTASILNKFLIKTSEILKEHPLNKERGEKGFLPANYLLVREAGKLKEIPSFKKKWQRKSCCIAGGGLYKGIAKVLKMDLIKVKGATGRADTDISGKLKAAKKAFKKYNFCYLHIKATDNFSHDGDFLGKKKFIEKFDSFLPILFDLKNTIIVITADHCTPCKVREHTKDPVPVLVYGNGKNGVQKFCEKNCKYGKLKLIKSIDFLKRLRVLAK